MNSKEILRNPGARAVAILAAAHLACTCITLLMATLLGAPFVPWFKDTFILLFAVLIHISLFTILWDGSLVSIALGSQWLQALFGDRYHFSISIVSMRKRRFLTCGPWPIVIVLLTAFAVLGTANVTLISLALLRRNPAWNDPVFWNLEKGIFQWITGLSVNPRPWDTLYHSSWTLVLLAAFVLTVIGRGTRLVLPFGLCMVVLFYAGRFVGLLTPVMGPAFYQPELFGYLRGSISDSALDYIRKMMELVPTDPAYKSGMLVGGVSAMPSLHIAMVTATAYWLAVGNPKTILVTLPWVLLVWTSTALLGWHYVLDGAGGIVLAVVCIACTRWLLHVWRYEVSPSATSG